MQYPPGDHLPTPMRAPVRGTQTPWGSAQQVEPVQVACAVTGVYMVTTASHGGIWVAPELRKHLPKGFRSRAYFEEDCDWCIPLLALGLPSGAVALRAAAEDTLRVWHPTLVQTLIRKAL